MDQEIKRKWQKELRRRKNPHKQGVWQLKDDDRYCCLGILARFVLGYSDELVGNTELGDLYVDDTTVLHRSTLTYDQEAQCIDWNDGEKLTFPQIANRIEDF